MREELDVKSMTSRSRARRATAAVAAAFAVFVVVPVVAAPAAHAALTRCETAAYIWDDRPDYNWNTHRPYMPVTNNATKWNRCELKYGSGGTGVRALQAALNECHGQSLSVDGDFGNKTRNALIAVQKSLGISADGVYGPTTNYYMRWPGNWEGGWRGPRCLSTMR